MKSRSSLLSQMHDKAWFQQLQQASHFRNAMQAVFDKTMPKDLLDIYHVLEIKKNILIVGSHQSGHASRFRYIAPQLLSALTQHNIFSSIKSIKCIVMPPKMSYQTQRNIKPIPKKIALSMRKNAEAIENPDLKAALLRLADNAEN